MLTLHIPVLGREGDFVLHKHKHCRHEPYTSEEKLGERPQDIAHEVKSKLSYI
jgi:hypothetical protein